ncbi:MAG: asparaginase [Rhizobiaceae bacterium]|nr:asparaginase [Rhizobiaceae bacterium]
MSNPVLVEVTRAGRVESRHRGCAIVVDDRGKSLFSLGAIETPVYPRSAVKAMQALPLVESGAADHYGFGNRELALACASHSGEPEHAALAAAMLAKAGLSETALECGCHWPLGEMATIELARTGAKPSQLHNNCSGKHAGFLCTACHRGIDPAGYIQYDHAIQTTVKETMAELSGVSLGVENSGIDGCGIPTFALPLQAIAHGFAKMASGTGLEPIRAGASKKLMDACMAEPFYVAGSKRACTRLMQTAPGRIFAKFGAEGVYCAALPREGIAMALKCDDGADRAAEAMVAALLTRYCKSDAAINEALMAQANRPLKNRNGLDVGTIRVTDALL